MPNSFKYNTSAETSALKKGNFWIGTGDVDKGPTSTTGFWNGISPPSGGFAIYLNKSSNGPSIYTVTTEAQLTGLTSTIAGQTLTTSGACLNWFATQTDKMILNKDCNGVITNGLVLSLDAGFTPSYPSTGTTWYDLSPSGNNGSLINGSNYLTTNGGVIDLDGSDDYINIPFTGSTTQNYTFTIVMKCDNMSTGGSEPRQTLFGLSQNGNQAYQQFDLEIWGNSGIGFRGNGNSGEGTNFFSYGWTTNGDANTINLYTVTLNSTGHKTYVNGKLTTTVNQNSTSDFNSITLGTRGSGGNYWNGQCFYFSVYNRILSDSEISQNYLNILTPKLIFQSNLKIWYDMSLQESTSNVDNVNTIDLSNNLTTLSRVYDLSGNGKHLTQTTKVNQPTFIRNSQNGKPANYNTGGQWYDADATVMYMNGGLTQGARSFFIVIKGASRSAFSWDRGGATPGSLQLGYDGGNGWNDLQQDTGFTIPGGNSTTTYVMSYMFDTNQSIFYRNGNLNRTQTNNTYTLNGNSVGCWTTAPSAGNQEGYWYEMVYLNKIPTIAEYNALVTYLGTKWGVSCGTLTNYN
jgi:hypothetical protein